MNDSLAETASLYVLDQLEPLERARVEERLVREPALAVLVRDYEAALAASVRALPPRAPAATMLEDIENRIDAEDRIQPAGTSGSTIEAFRLPPSASRPSRNPWVTFAQWGLAAVITVSLATLAVQSLRRAPAAQPVFVVVGLDSNRSTFAELPQPGLAAKDPDARFIQLASAAEDLWRNPAARPLPAAASGTSRGYALFDPASQQGFIGVEQLPAITPNQRYHLWITDSATGQVRDAGVLPLDSLGRGLYSFTTEPPTGTKSAPPQLFVTLEETDTGAATPVQPRGKVVLGKGSF